MTDLKVVSEKEDMESIKPKATLAEITFSGGDKVELSENEMRKLEIRTKANGI